MSAGTESAPLIKIAPEAEFVGLGERKPIATIEWSAAQLRTPPDGEGERPPA